MKRERIYGHELKVGDTIEVWWNGGRDIICGRKETPKYAQKFYDDNFPHGAWFAEFVLLRTGMTIDNNDIYYRLTPN